MRRFCVLLMVFGLIGGAAYPWYVTNFSGEEIGTYRVYRRTLGFKAAKVVLSTNQSPVRVFVDMTPVSGYYPVLTRTMLTVTSSTAGKTVFAAPLDFVSTSTQTQNLQTTEAIFRDHAGDFNVVKPGQYTFTVGEGDVEGLSMKSVNLVLYANAKDPDRRVQPIGIALFLLGLIGLIRSMRRTEQAEPTATPETQVTKPKWGRAADDEK